MLKSMPNGSTSRRPPPTTTHHVLIDSPFQTPANPPATSRPLENVTKNWGDCANGGAATDDAQYLQKSREEEAKYLEAIRKTTPVAGSSSKPATLIKLSLEKKSRSPIADPSSKAARLIELSPKKNSVSRNTNLLIDLDVGPAPAMGQIQQSYAGAASYKGKGKAKAKAFPNFLD
jgi:helicase required for RNAi-mediated heterochromatin assembly 1